MKTIPTTLATILTVCLIGLTSACRSATPAATATAPAAATSTTTSTSTSTSTSTTTQASTAAATSYTQSGNTAALADQAFSAAGTDESGVKVSDGGALTLTRATVTTSGNTSSDDKSSFYGLNAAVLAESGSSITLADGVISTTGRGANGAFATGSGSSVVLTRVTLTATGDGGHGVMATQGGVMTLDGVNMATSGAHSAAIATDRGGGTILATGGRSTTSGQDSPCVYSTGTITVTGAACSATGAESAVIEGANTIDLVNTDLTSSVADKWGVMIYQSMSGDAEGTQGRFNITGGSLSNTASNGPLFYVTNSTGIITLKGASLTAASGTLVQAAANSRWGASGSNGGTAIVTADGQTLAGNLVADSISVLSLTLQNGSTLTGAVNADNAARSASLALDASSTWTVTADSHLACLADSGAISGDAIANITGNGHTVYYTPAACADLGGRTYTLNGGGYLKPAS